MLADLRLAALAAEATGIENEIRAAIVSGEDVETRNLHRQAKSLRELLERSLIARETRKATAALAAKG